MALLDNVHVKLINCWIYPSSPTLLAPVALLCDDLWLNIRFLYFKFSLNTDFQTVGDYRGASSVSLCKPGAKVAKYKDWEAKPLLSMSSLFCFPQSVEETMSGASTWNDGHQERWRLAISWQVSYTVRDFCWGHSCLEVTLRLGVTQMQHENLIHAGHGYPKLNLRILHI